MNNKHYLPEGRLIGTAENDSAVKDMSSVRQSMADSRILEGCVQKCDSDLNLTVSVGGLTGYIPKSETSTGESRDIAIISRVGKPVCFKITDIQDDRLILSRKQAQEEALEYFLKNLETGDVIDATVIHMEPFGAFVDMGCGIPAMISIDKISTARIPHPSERFSPGMQIHAVVSQVDKDSKRFNLSHKELLGTWEENTAHFTQGETVQGIVRSVQQYGAFVELAPNLSGLTEPCENITEGDRVSVYIKSIVPEKRKVKLIIISKLESGKAEVYTPDYYITEGNVSSWKY